MIKHVKITITQTMPPADDIKGWRIDEADDVAGPYTQIVGPTGFPYSGTPQPDYSYEYDVEVPPLQEIYKYYKAYSVDKDGNTSDASNIMSVLLETLAPPPPEVTDVEVIYT